MSSGAFLLTKYELNGGATIVPIRVQPDTVSFDVGGTTNAAVGGAINLSVSAYTRKSTRSYGIGARGVTISWNGSAPADYEDENLSIPILSEAFFNNVNVGDNATYLGTACTIVSKKQEQLT